MILGKLKSSNGTREFLEPILKWYKTNFPSIKLIFRGESGFASPKIYTLLEEYGVDYMHHVDL